jgi:hypothetical protein
MPRTHQNAVYNAGIRQMPSRLVRAAYLGLFASLLVPDLHAADWHPPEQQLAGKIVAVTGPGALSLDVVNRSSLTQGEAETIRQGLLAQLVSLGGHIVNPDQAAATVQVALSEDLQNYVWVAVIHQGSNEPAVVMAAAPRTGTPAVSRESPALTLHKTFVWSQEERILDAEVINATPPHMLILDPSAVTLYRWQESRWQMEQSLPIVHLHPWPRDLRGRLVLRQDHLFEAYLPGVFCRSTTSATMALNCYESDDPWPVGTGPVSLNAFFASTRNYFTGALAPGIGKKTTAPPFYSAAPLPRDKYTLWVFATLDGQLHLLDGITDQAARPGWGSDIASVRSNCGTGWQMLATSPGDGPNDSVRAFEVPDREPVAASLPVEFSGSITALWTESEGSDAVAVSHNPATERYEAFRLSIACGQ